MSSFAEVSHTHLQLAHTQQMLRPITLVLIEQLRC
jgi:hypothetical protein